MGIFNFLKRKAKNKIVICGLDSSGKSTIVSFLETGTFVQHTPTMGKKRSDFVVQGTKLSLFDMGGQADFRKFWAGELSEAKCLIFVIDKVLKSRFQEAKKELHAILPTVFKNNLKLIVLANKSDLPGGASIAEIIETFELNKVDSYEIFETSARTGYGLADAFAKIYSLLTGEVIKKTVVAKAVSIFNKSGIPLITKAEDLDQKIIEGGFFSAITAFANTQLESNSITFKSEKSGTFIVLRSENFIGSLLWNEDLSVPMADSEEALKELLNHLEKTGGAEDSEKVKFNVSQYCTNLM